MMNKKITALKKKIIKLSGESLKSLRIWHIKILHTAYSPNVAGDSAAVLNGRHLDLADFQTALLKIPLLNFQVFFV